MSNSKDVSVVLSAVDNTKAAFQSVSKNLDSVGGAAQSLNGIFARLAPLIGAASFTELIKSSLNTADQLGKLAQKSGVTIESFSRLSVAAKLSDVDMQQLASGMGRLSTSIATAASGTGTQSDAFKALGISVKDAHGNLKNADQIMVEVADRFSSLEDGSGKTAAAIAIFGKAGADLIPMLNQGGQEMVRMAGLSDQLGLTLNGKTSQAAQDVNDRFTVMGMAAQGVGLQVMNNMLPALTKISEQMVGAATDTGLMKDVADSLTVALKGLMSIGLGVGWVFKTLGDNIGGAAAAAMAAVHGDFAGASRILEEMQRGNQQRTESLANSINSLWSEANQNTGTPQTPNKKNTLNFSLGGSGSSKKQRTFDPEGDFWFAVDEAQYKNRRKAQEEADKSFARSVDEANKIIFDTDPMAKANHEWQRLLDLQATVGEGMLSNETIGKAYEKTMTDVAKNGSDEFKRLEDAVRGWGNAFTDTMTQMVMTGKLNFSSLADSIISDLIRIQIQENITKPLMNAGTDFLGSIFGKPTANANGGVYAGTGISAFSGQVVDRPTLFPFARGVGLMGEAGPEAILPLTRINGRLGVESSGGGVTVQNNIQVVNAPGTQAQVQQRQNNSGGMDFTIIIEQIEGGIARNVSRGAGELSGTLERTFGLNRAAGAYR